MISSSFQTSQGDPGASEAFVFSSLPSQHPPTLSKKRQLTADYDWLIKEHLANGNPLAIAGKRDLNQLLRKNLESCSGSSIQTLPSCRCAELVKELPWPQDCPLIEPREMDSKSQAKFSEGVTAMQSCLRSGISGFEPSPGRPCPLLGLHKATLARLKQSSSRSRKRCRGQDAQTLAKRKKAQGETHEGLDQNGSSYHEPSSYFLAFEGGLEDTHSPQRLEAERQVRSALLHGEQFAQNLITYRFFELLVDNKPAFRDYLRLAIHDGAGPPLIFHDEIPPPVEYDLTRLLWSCKGEQKSLQLDNAIRSLRRYPQRDRDFALTEEALGVLDALRSTPPSPQDRGHIGDAQTSDLQGVPFRAAGFSENLEGLSNGEAEATDGDLFNFGSFLNTDSLVFHFGVKSLMIQRMERPYQAEAEERIRVVVPRSLISLRSFDEWLSEEELLKIQTLLESLRHSRPALAAYLETFPVQNNAGFRRAILKQLEAVMKQLEAAAAAEAERFLQKQNRLLRKLQTAQDIINQDRLQGKGGSRKGRHKPVWGPHGEVEESSSGSNSGGAGVPRRKRERRQ